ncbi:hypothetical protein ABPG75_012780 [Micractinium tetrahymenae]
MWLHLSPTIGLPRPLYLCLCYLPPATSTHHTHLPIPPLSAIASDIHHLSSIHQTPPDILLAGDFNARTANLPDGAAPYDHTALSPLIPQLPPDLRHSPPSPLPPRLNSDKTINPQGREFLQLLCEASLAIANGRTPSDRPGACTCGNINGRGTSTVDHFASSLPLFPLITDLIVLPHVPESDHRHLLLSIRCTLPTSPPPPAASPSPSIPRFRYSPTPDSIKAYQAALAADPDLSPTHLSSLPPNEAATTLQQRLLHHISTLYPPLPPPRPNRHPNHQRHQPWFDQECKETRRRYRAALQDPTSHLAHHLSIQYKKTHPHQESRL